MSTLNINSLSINQKRDLVKQLRAAIKSESLAVKQFKVIQKAKKEEAKKEKIANQIKLAQEKLAKLQAKLA